MASAHAVPRALGRFLVRHRRAVAAVFAAAAVACALTAVRPPGPQRVTVLAAASDLTAGATLSGSEVAHVALRPRAVPDGALRPGTDITGRVLAGPMRAGEPLTDAAFAQPALLADSDAVAAPVRIADGGVARLLQAGDRVDVLAASTRGETLGRPARVVAAGVRVVAIPRRGGGTARVAGQGTLIVVAATPEDAAQLAGAAVTSRLTVTLRRG